MSYNRDYLMHFGIKGQRWGVRRFQNEDGTLTEAGRVRYLGSDFERGIGAVTLTTYNIYNKTGRRVNGGISKINKEYRKKYGKNYDLNKDDSVHLEYNRQIRDVWQKTYRDVLAEDLKTDPSVLKGQKWLDEMYGYKTNIDDDIEALEKKLSEKSKEK